MNERKNNSGVLFKNNKTKDTQPDYNGYIKVNDVDMKIAGWIKKKNDKSYMSLRITPPEGTSQQDQEEDLPF